MTIPETPTDWTPERWRTMNRAPRDGTWIIAVCNDGHTLKRVSWGRSRHGAMCWCSADDSFGDGLFRGWLPWPLSPTAEASAADAPAALKEGE